LLPGLLTLGNAWLPLGARQHGLDLVHDPAGVSPFLFGAGGARTVVTVHDAFPWSCPGTSTLLETLIYRYWLPRLLPRVDAVITVSQASRRDITRYLPVPQDKVHVVYNGVDRGFRPEVADAASLSLVQPGLSPGYILAYGAAPRRKNLAGALRGYARLRAEMEVPPLVVIGGKGGQEHRLAPLLQELDLVGRVIFTGYVPNEDLPALYRGASLFVFPSLYEGFGLPPLEAMACGTPVVCSNTSSLPEVVGDAALTVDPTDVEALAGAMQRVLSDRDLAQDLRRRGLERAAGFNWERTARDTASVYQRLCSEP
jgi:glycosyltransferase involved in cell wall biosynthesis